jgi:hypothetical protein
MKRPEDDPVIVTMIAANLLGRYCHDWPTALSEARHGLKMSPRVIAREKEQEAIDAEMWEDSISEAYFINLLCAGLLKATRADRKKSFVTRWWTALRRAHPEAPALDDAHSWTLATLQNWKDRFDHCVRKGRAESSRSNWQKKRRLKSGEKTS